jgi:hypothetical protein
MCFGICLAWRLLFAMLFAGIDYVGGGGDGMVYHVLGLYARDVVFGVPGPPLSELIFSWWTDTEALEAKYSGVLVELQASGTQLFRSDTLPVILLHGGIYYFVPHPLAFTALVSVLSAFANAKLIEVTHVTGGARALIVLNPLSTYFAATHLKEGLTEVLLIGLVISRWITARRVLPFLFAAMLILFRPSFWPICLLVLIAPNLSRLDSRLIVIVAVVAALMMPGMQWEMNQTDGGFLFSVVRMNELTQEWLGLLIGFGAPYPVPVGAWAPFTIAMWFGGIVYWAILPRTLLSFATRPDNTMFVWVPILLSAIIGYVVVGDLASKTRFFSPMLPMLIVGWFMARQTLAAGAPADSSAPAPIARST